MLDLGDVLRDLAASGEVACIAVVVEAGRGPVRPGAKAVYDGAGARRGGDAVFPAKLERELGAAAADALAAGEPALVSMADDACGATLKVYLEPQGRSRELLVLGEGPVASAVVRIGEASGFRVRAVAEGFAKLPAPGKNAHVVVATGHEADEEALVAALRGEPATLQLVASSKRGPIIRAALKKAGVPDAKVAQLRSPAGLDLGGDSPEEIALSILAEVVAVRRGGTGRPLAEVKAAGAKAPHFAPPSFLTPSRKPKVKFALEDSEEPREPTRHDEDFRPDDEPARPAKAEKTEKIAKAEKGERLTRRTKKRPAVADDEESFR